MPDNNKTPLYQPPVPSTEFEGDARLFGNVLRFQYSRDGVAYRGGIRFGGVAASRARAERCCTSWHIKGAYDTLVEIDGSVWSKEIKADTAERWRNHWKMRHFMIYLDSVGCFEIIADSWEALPEEAGRWP